MQNSALNRPIRPDKCYTVNNKELQRFDTGTSNLRTSERWMLALLIKINGKF